MNTPILHWIAGTAICAALSSQSPLPESSSQPIGPDIATESMIGMFERADGTLGADGTTYHADFDSRGATMMVRDPRTDEQSVALTLRLTDWGRGNARKQIQTSRAGRASTSVARFDHGGITERYEVTATGFEQSFVVAQRPAGSGDLVLGIAATGSEIHAPACSARQQELEFYVGETPTFRYGEAIAFSRGSTERVPVATRYDGNGRIELVVAASFVDTASYPIVIDPAVGPVQSVSGTGFKDINADVAYDPDAETFMVVWQREFNVNDVRIRVQRYRRDGSPISGIGPLTGVGFTQYPTVAYIRTGAYRGFYVVWSHSTGLRGQLLNSNGTGLLSPVHQLTTTALGVRDRRATFSVRSNSILLAWDHTPNGSSNPTSIRARRCEFSNTVQPSVTLGNESTVETASGSGYVQRPRMPRRHDFSGAPINRICWERFYANPAPGDFDVRHAYITLTMLGINFPLPPSNMPGGSSIGTNERRPDIASIDGQSLQHTLVVWEDEWDIRGHRFNITGALGSDFTIRATSRLESEPTVGAGSTEYSVGYLSAPSGDPSVPVVYAARVSTGGDVMAQDSPISMTDNKLRRGLRASSVSRADPLINSPNGVMFSWTLESDAIGTINDVMARYYEPVAGDISPYGSACPGPGGTLPTIQANGSPYPGNASFAIELTNAPANTLVALMLSTSLTDVPIPGAPGCQLYVDFPLVTALPMVSTPTGFASAALPIPVGAPPGALFGSQWAVYTPGHNAFGWISSDDLDLSWQQ